MTKIDIFSGFLGAGKTTLIKKLLAEALQGQKIVLIENEFGEIGIDSGFLQEAGIAITEINSGCICCSLVGDFAQALKQVQAKWQPERILIEPSGVGKLSDVIAAIERANIPGLVLNSATTIVDAGKCKMYMKNFGEFFNNQVEAAGTIILSRTDKLAADKLDDCLALLHGKNPAAEILTTHWEQVTGNDILAAIEHPNRLQKEMDSLLQAETHQHQQHAAYCDHDHDHEHDHVHEHHACCGHDHDHDHEHEHAHHHDAAAVFTSWGAETAHYFSKEQIRAALAALADEAVYGTVLRAKGIVAGTDGAWIHFDYVPGESDLRTGPADVSGRLCIIGASLHEEALAKLFGIEA